MMNIEFENQLRRIANGMEYPRTPDIVGSVATRLRTPTRSRSILKRWVWSLIIVLFLCSSLMFVPNVRAAIIEFIQIGIVRIFPQPAEATVEPITTATPETTIRTTATSGETLQLLIPFLDQIAGETKLESAKAIVPYQIMLPSYPGGLGQPQHVYVQDTEGAMTILIWTDPKQPEWVTMSLHFIPVGHWAISKFAPVVIQETEVNGQQAVWAVGPYPLFMKDGQLRVERLINGHVLIWADGGLTYRLETDLPPDEAVKSAESLEPIP